MEATRIAPPAPPGHPTRVQMIWDSLGALGLLAAVWAGMWVPDVLFVAGRRFNRFTFPLEHHAVTPGLAFVVAAACILPLALRRRFPAAVLAVIAVATALYQAFLFPPSFVIVGLLIALYTAGSVLPMRRFLLWAIPSGVLVVASSLPAWGTQLFWPDFVRQSAIFVAAGVLGVATRNRRDYYAEVERRAAEAERTRDEEARRRVDEERLRIARELHDVTAHSLSIVAVQSGVALHVLDSDPEAARTALVAIRETSRSSLNELRGMLGVLRASGDVTGELPLTPTPGLTRIDELVGPLREAGLKVEVVAPGPGEPLPAMVEASAYRIVQEALTNVLRHAGSASVRVAIERDAETLTLDVTNSGPAGTRSTEGHGIAGMRERALALGGTFSAGPRSDGGWSVHATLPLSVRSSS